MNEEDMYIMLSNLEEELRRIRVALETIAQSLNPDGTGNYLIQIDSVDKETYRKILAEAKTLGGSYSRKYHGFVFEGKEVKE